MILSWQDFLITREYDYSCSGVWSDEQTDLINDWAAYFNCSLVAHSGVAAFSLTGSGQNKRLYLTSAGGESTSITLQVPEDVLQVKFKRSGSDNNPVIRDVVDGKIILSGGRDGGFVTTYYYSEVSLGYSPYEWNHNQYLNNAQNLLALSIDRENWTSQQTYKQQDMALLWKNYCINNKCINAQGFYTTYWGTINSYNNQQIKNRNFNFITSLWFAGISQDLSEFMYTDNNEWYYSNIYSEQYSATYGPFYIIELDTALECDANKCANTSFYFNIKQTSPKYYFLPTTHNPNKTLRQELEEITTGWTTTQLLETKEVSRTFSNTDISVTYNVLYPKTDFQWEYSNYSYPFIVSYSGYPRNYITSYGLCYMGRVLLKYNLGSNNTLSYPLRENRYLSTAGDYDYFKEDGSHFDGSTAGSLFYQRFHHIVVQTLGCNYPISIKNETIPSISIDYYETNPGQYSFSFEGLGTSYNHYFTGKKISQNGDYYNTWEQDGVYTWWYDNSDSYNRQYHFRNIMKIGTNSKLYYVFVARNIDGTHY